MASAHLMQHGYRQLALAGHRHGLPDSVLQPLGQGCPALDFDGEEGMGHLGALPARDRHPLPAKAGGYRPFAAFPRVLRHPDAPNIASFSFYLLLTPIPLTFDSPRSTIGSA